MNFKSLQKVTVSVSIALLTAAVGIYADTGSWPVSVAIPTGMSGELVSRPVSIVVPTGMSGEMISRPVSVALPVTVENGVYMARPATVGVKPANYYDPDLVGLWHMDGDWGDSSGNNHHGGPYNATFNSTNKIGVSSGSFNGIDSRVMINDSSVFQSIKYISVGAWINPGKIASSGVRQTILSFKEGDNPINVGVVLALPEDATDKLRFWVKINNAWSSATSSAAIVPNVWQHVVGTYDGATIKVYVNGILSGQTQVAGTMMNGAGNPSTTITIGARASNNTNWFQGLIDEVAIYKRALSVEEVAYAYSAGISDPQAPPPPALNPVQAFVGTSSITLSGIKTPGTSVWVNNKLVTAADDANTWTGTFGTLQPGMNNLSISVMDSSFRQSQSVGATVFYDNLPPVIESSIPANNSDTSRPVASVSINLIDAASSVDLSGSIQGATVKNRAGQAIAGNWTISGTKTIIFTPAEALPSDTYKVNIYPVDAVGNRGAAQLEFTNYDVTPPVSTLTLSGTLGSDGWHTTNATVSITASDGSEGTGVLRSEFSFDNATWQTYSSAFVIDTDGVKTVYYRSLDKAGNTESTKSKVIKINKTGIVALFHMDNNWQDSSIVGNHGTAYNGATFSSNAKIGTHAGSFNGANYVSVPDSSSLRISTAFTIEAWINPNSLNSYMQIISKHPWTSNLSWQMNTTNTGKLRVDLSTTGTTYSTVISNTSLTAGVWQHVAATWDGETVKLFINGVQDSATLAFSGQLFQASTSMDIGRVSGSNNQMFYGLIDEVTIHNRALTTQEIQENYLSYSIPLPVVDPVQSPTNNPTLALTGTKPADTAVVVNGITVAPLDGLTTWSGSYTLKDGLNTLEISAMDSGGFHSQHVTVSIALDRMAPVVTSSNPPNYAIFNQSVSSVAFNLSDAFSSLDLNAAITGASVKKSGQDVSGSWSTTGTGMSGTVAFTPDFAMTEGSYSVSIKPTDAFGNTSVYSMTFTVDMTPPQTPTIDPVVSPTNLSSQTLKGSKGTDSVSVVLSGAGLTFGQVSYPSATTWSAAVSNLKEGSNTIAIYAVDSAANQSATISATIMRDTVPPSQPVVNAVPSPTTASSVLLTGTKEAYSYLYINGTKTAISFEGTSWSYTANLAEGGNTFTIYAKDEAGNQGQSASVTIVRDTTPPLVSSSTPAGGAFISQGGNIEIYLSDAGSTIDLTASLSGATVKNSSGAVVGGQWSVVSGKLVFTPDAALTDSTYTVTIYPVDALGNKGTVTFTFTVDSAPPAVQSLSMNPVSPVKAQAVTFTINFNEDMLTSVQSVVSFTRGGANPVYSIPSGSWTNSKTWSGSYTFTTATGDGNYTISISGAKDKAGNSMAASGTYSFVLDAVAPAAPIVNPVVSPTKSSSITITGTKDAESYIYVNNVKTTALYSDTAWSYTVNLSEGNNSISIYAKDEAENQSQSVAVNVVRDTTPPAISSSTPAANAFVSQAGTVDVQLSDTYSTVDIQGSIAGATVKNSGNAVVSGQWSVVSGKLVFTPSAALTDSVYTATIYPVDSLGNKGTATLSFTLDSTPPTVQSVTMTPDSPHKAETVTFSITFNEDMLTSVQPAVTFSRGFLYSTYTVTGSWANSRTWNGTSQFTTNNGDGTYTVKVAGGQDKAQNSMTAQSSWTFVLDTTSPDAPTLNAVTTPTKTTTVALSGIKPADTAIIINGSQRVALNSSTSWSYTYNLSEGPNSLSITARDAAGNDSTPVSASIVLDTTPPNFTVNYVTPSPTQSQTLTGTKEPGSVVKLNGSVILDATDQNGTWSYAVTLIEGLSSHLVFTAADSLGNTTTKAIDILYDLSAPTPLAEGMLVADGNGKGTEVTLSWPSYVESADLAYYRVYSSKTNFTSTNGITAIATTNKGTKTFKATGLTQGTTYYFAVVPVDISGNSDATVHTASAVPTDTAAPEEVTALTLTAGYNSTDGNYVSLKWTASINSTGDLADQVIYFDNGSGYDAGTPIGKTATTYKKTGLNDAAKYRFKVTTKDAGGHESFGAAVDAVTRLNNPTNLASTPGNGKVTLTWDKSGPWSVVSGQSGANYVKQFNIYRVVSPTQQTNISGMTLITTLSASTNAYTDTGLTNGTTYQYAVTAVNTFGAERTDAKSIATAPRGDTTGPAISGLNITQNQVISVPVTITATAQDAESAMGKMDIYVDGAPIKSQTGGTISYFWNVVDATDGNHSIKIAAYDSLGNVTEQTLPVVVSLAPPAVPVITGHTNTATTPQYLVTVNGTAPLSTTVTLRVNGTVVTSQQASSSTFTFTSISLVEGDNLISVRTTHRGGESAWSPDYKVTVDTGAPNAPASLAAKSLAGGTLQFTWQAGTGEVPTGYNLYVSNSSFASRTDAGVTKVNATPIAFLFKEYIPSDDNKKYYGVTALDGAGNESGMSNVVSIASDRTSPSLASIGYTYTDINGVVKDGVTLAGPGTVKVTVTISEPLSELPFLSLEPIDGSPIVVSLKKVDDTHYEGTFTVNAQTPHGPTTYKFSGKDIIGNRGNSQGAGITIDSRGPIASVTSPLTLLQITTNPVEVKVTFDEAPVGAPVLEVRDSKGVSTPITGLSLISGLNWKGATDISALSEGTAEFILREAKDSLGNISTKVASGRTILLYKDTVPAPSVPTGLTAATVKDGKINLRWDNVTYQQSAVTYNLYRRAEGETTAVQVATSLTANTFSDIPPAEGKYYYSVTSIGLLNSESAKSNEVSATSDRTGPPTPTGLVLTLDGNGVKAVWTPGPLDPLNPGTLYYRLYRSDGAITTISGLTPVATVITPTASDPSPTSAKRFYAVTSMDALGNESVPSETQDIVFPVAPVRDLTLSRVDTGKPTLTWQAPEGSIQGYYIYRNGQKVNETPTLSTSYSDGYYSGGTIAYGISAVDGYGMESPVREAMLPELTIGLKDGTTLRRGVLETVSIIANCKLQNENCKTVDAVALKIGALPESTLNGPFAFTPGPLDPLTPGTLEVKKVAATEANAPAEVAVITTAIMNPSPGTTIKITRSSIANVLSSGSALEIFNEPLVRGTTAKVRLKLNNLGSARTDMLTSQNNGPTGQVKVNLRDQDGNLLATGNLDQRVGSLIVDSGSYATARIEAGNSFLTDPITFGVPASAPYKVIIEAIIDNTYYHYNQAEQVTAPGFKQSVESTIVETAYMATATSDKSIYKQGESIKIAGQAVSTSNGQPMPNVPVKVGISVRGFDRYYTVNSDASGNFSYIFTPGYNEAGTFSVWAVHPDINDRTVQGQFNIVGLQISPTTANIRIIKNQSFDVPVTLRNLGDASLAGLSCTTTSSAGVTVGVTNSGDNTLAAGESQYLTFRVTGGATSGDIATAGMKCMVDGGQGQTLEAQLDVNITLVQAIPIISTNPSLIDTGLVRGSQKIYTFDIKNTGLDTLKNARLDGPSSSWMSLTIDKNIGDIGANQSKTVGILVKPGDSVAQGVYNDRITIYSDNHIPYTFNIQATVTSSAIGNVLFDILNQLLEDVKGASITLQNQALPELMYNLTTSADGTASIYDIPEGRYSFNITASGHKSYSGSVTVAPGVTVTVPVAMEVTLVDVQWSVVPTTIQDRYEIQITQTFQTNVPVPVLISEPTSITIPDMQPGQVYNGEFRVKNYGLISANNMKLNFPNSFMDYDIEMLSTMPDKIGAMQSITMPYRITRRQAVAELQGSRGQGFEGSSIIANLNPWNPGTLDHSNSLFDEVQGYGSGGCVTSFTISSCGDYTMCPNTPQASTGNSCTSFTVAVPLPCASGNGSSGSTGTGSYVYTGGSGTGSQGGGGWLPGGTPTLLPGQDEECGDEDPPICAGDNCCTVCTNSKVDGSGIYEDGYIDLEIKTNGIPISFDRYYTSRWSQIGRLPVEGVSSYSTGRVRSVIKKPSVDGSIVGTATYKASITPQAYGWTSPWFAKILGSFGSQISNVSYFDGYGHIIAFTVDRSGNYIAAPGGERYVGEKGLKVLKTQTGYQVQDKRGIRRNFVFSGSNLAPWHHLDSIEDAKGNKVTLNYDSDDRLISVTDASGVVSFKLTYNEKGFISSVEDRDGRKVDYTVDTNGRLLEAVGPQNNKNTYEYDTIGNYQRLLRKKDPEGNETNIEYKPGELVVSKVTEPNGKSRSFSFDFQGYTTYYTDTRGISTTYISNKAGKLVSVEKGGRTIMKIDYLDGRVERVTDEAGNTRTIRKNEKYDPIAITDGKGNTTRIEYNQYWKVSKITDPLGNAVTFDYDQYERLTTVKYPNGEITNYEYDNLGNVTKETRGQGAETSSTLYEYNGRGNPIKVTDPLGNLTNLTYDQYGHLSGITDAKGNLTEVANDIIGRPLTVKDPLNNTKSYTYDKKGHVKTATDEAGNISTYSYDFKGRVTSVTDAKGILTTYTYDGEGSLTEIKEAAGTTEEKVTRINYDELNRKSSVTDPMGNLTRYEYTGATAGCATCKGGSAEIPAKVTDPLGNITTLIFDENGKVTGVKDPLNNISSTVYDTAGRKTKQTDANGNATTYIYDASGRITKQTDANGGDIIFTYDSRGNLITLTDQNGSKTTFEYDAANRKTKETRPMGQTTEYTYHPNGLLKTVKDAKGQTTTYTYDVANRLTDITYADGKKDTFTYEVNGNLVTYSNAEVSSALTYDSLNRKLSETVNYGAFSKTYGYSYDTTGNKVTYTSPEGTIYTYNYNKNDQPTSITFGAKTIGLNYQWERLTKATLPNGVATDYAYNVNSWLSAITTQKGATTLSSSQYGFDKVGNITSKISEQGNNSFSYDNLHQLTNATLPTLPQETFTYDNAGNRLTVTFSNQPSTINYIHNANNEMTSYDAATLTYDANGNTTQETNGSNTTKYTYSAVDRLERVELPDGRIATYKYDPFGRRISKQIGTETTYYLYADEGLIGEYDTSGNLKKAYGWMPGSVWGTNPVFMYENGQYYYYQNDHLGTPQKITDGNGNVVWSATYTAFGEAIVDPASTVTNNLRYPGQYYDEETGLHYNLNRYYNPKTGRYVVKDPIGYVAGDVNLYRYVGNNPVNAIDPTGLATVVIVGRGTGSNPFGHVAIGFTGQGVYSYGTGTSLGADLTDYLTKQAAYRDSIVYTLDTTSEQEAKMLAEILKYRKIPLPDPFKDAKGAMKDTCATRTQKALEAGDITSILLPFTSPFPNDTQFLAIINGATAVRIPKGGTIPSNLSTFNRR